MVKKIQGVISSPPPTNTIKEYFTPILLGLSAEKKADEVQI